MKAAEKKNLNNNELFLIMHVLLWWQCTADNTTDMYDVLWADLLKAL